MLVSTTIIESGLDIPNVNTLIVNRADRSGWRSSTSCADAWARSNQGPTPTSSCRRAGADRGRKRLRAIEEFDELGAGFPLAMRDLEIRGAGNLLGREQSGHMAAVGFDMYCRDARETMAELRGDEQPEERLPVRMDIAIDAYLPEDYISDPDQRIVFYKRLADMAEVEGVPRMAEELRDRYGRLPEEAHHLLKVKELRLLAEASGVDELRARDGRCVIRFHEGRTPPSPIVREMVRLVPAELAFFTEGRDGLRVEVKAEGHRRGPRGGRGPLAGHQRL